MVAMGSVSQMHTQQPEQQKVALAAREERVIRLTITDFDDCGFWRLQIMGLNLRLGDERMELIAAVGAYGK